MKGGLINLKSSDQFRHPKEKKDGRCEDVELTPQAWIITGYAVSRCPMESAEMETTTRTGLDLHSETNP